MENIKVKDLIEILKNLDCTKEVKIINSFSVEPKIEVEYIKELKENGKDYFKINIYGQN